MAVVISDQRILKNTSYGHEQLATVTFDDADEEQSATIVLLTGAPKGIAPTHVTFQQTVVATDGTTTQFSTLDTGDLTVPDFDVQASAETAGDVAGAVVVVRAMWEDAADMDGGSLDNF